MKENGTITLGGVPDMLLSQELSLSQETLLTSIGNNTSTTLMDRIEKTLLSSIEVAIQEGKLLLLFGNTWMRKLIKALLLVRDVKKQVDVLMSTHITQPSSNAVPLEVEEDLANVQY